MTAASWRFRRVYEERLDHVWTTSRFILKQLDYSLSISMRERWLGLRPRQFVTVTVTLWLMSVDISAIGPLHDPVTWYRINYAGTQVTQWDFQNKGTRTSPTRLSFVLEVPLCNLRPSIIYSAPRDRIVQRAYLTIPIKCLETAKLQC